MKVARAHKITICRRVPNTQTKRLLNTLSTKPLTENRPETLSTSQQIMNFFDMTPETAKWLGVLGITTTLGIAAVWLYNREVVPFSGRKRFRFVDPTWHAKYDARSDPDIKKGLEMLDNGHKNPELLWSDDHPATKIVRRIFSKLIAESGLDRMDWDVQILSTKGRYLSPLLLHSRRLTHSQDSSTPKRYPIVMVTPNGKVVVFSEGLKTLSDEAELAAILSKGISEVAIGLRAEHYCNSLLITGVQYACYLNIAALQISGRCWLVLPLPVLPLFLLIAIVPTICSFRMLKQETDYVSMVIMSKAGYDPRAYVKNAKKMVEINESLLKRIQEELACELTIVQVTQFLLQVPESLNANHLSRNSNLSRKLTLPRS